MVINLLEKLNELGWFGALLAVAATIVLIPAVIDSWKKFKSSIGLKSNTELEDEKLEKTLKSLQNQIDEFKANRISDRKQSMSIQKELTDSINNITSAINEMKSDALETKIDRMRWKILDFASRLRNGEITHPEQFSNVLKTYDAYEKILDEHELTNGQIDESIKFIKEKYHEILVNEN